MVSPLSCAVVVLYYVSIMEITVGLLPFEKVLALTRNPHPIYNFLSYHHQSLSYCSIISFVSSINIPKNVKEILDYPR